MRIAITYQKQKESQSPQSTIEGFSLAICDDDAEASSLDVAPRERYPEFVKTIHSLFFQVSLFCFRLVVTMASPSPALARGPRKRSKKRPALDDSETRQSRMEQEIETLQKRIVDECPAKGYVPPHHHRVAFRTLPLSEATLRGLDEAPFTTMTTIQNACIPHALAGRDILGAARTGSGKTLAFLVPVLEVLYRNRYTPLDGPGAVVLSPTRELAVQIFQVLKVIGKHHSFSVGLLIGGRKKDFDEEQQRVGTTNILIATPGRLLQHLEQTPYFDLSALRILVLDEADRILDMGFREQLLRLLEYIPKEDRQTLLFSATQTRDVKHLATLSLRQPEYLGVHDKEKTSTPQSLQQSYIVVPLEHKLNAVYSFVKSHLKCKTIIFLASCAQVRYAWELFCSLRPGLPVMALHGKLVQEKRTKIYFDFIQKPHAVLFATDIAARGLDFPNVDWVVQVDAPEDRETYIHRAGRTARYRAGGKALLILTPSEEKKGFIKLLNNNLPTDGGEQKSKPLPLKKLTINPNKASIVTQRAASMVASNVKLNELAKKAYRSYVRSIYLMPRKEIFSVEDIPTDEFSKSLGLASTPSLRFLQTIEAQDRSKVRERKNVNHKLQRLKEQIKIEKLTKKMKKMSKSDQEIQEAIEQLKQQSHPHLVKKEKQSTADDASIDSDAADGDLLVSKGRDAWDKNSDDSLPDARVDRVSAPRHASKIRIDGGSAQAPNKHVYFDEDGREENADDILLESKSRASEILKDKQELSRATDDYLDRVRQRLQDNKDQDERAEKERVRQKHKKRRLEEKQDREMDGEEGQPIAMLAPLDDDDSSESESSSDDSLSSSSSSSSESSSDTEEEDLDLKAQEDIALSLIRGKVQ